MPLDSTTSNLQGDKYTDEEREFLLAMQEYKKTRRRPFPSWSEVLAVVHSLGYRRVERRQPLPQSPVATRPRRQL